MASELPTKEELERWSEAIAYAKAGHVSDWNRRPVERDMVASLIRALVLLSRAYERISPPGCFYTDKSREWASVKLPGDPDDA